jgi:branched-chain amino acid transport system substrate-binding protein
MNRRLLLQIAAAAALAMPGAALAQDTVKIGLILPMTGQQASTGKQIKAAVDLYWPRTAPAWPARRSR